MKSIQEKHTTAGFSVMELLVVGAICAAFFTAAALVYQNVSASQSQLRTFADVSIGLDQNENFYGNDTSDTVRPYFAPNFGRGRLAMALRDELEADLEVASAVYCLNRDALNTVRPTEFALGTTDGNALDTGEKFRQFINTEFPDAALIYGMSRGAIVGQSGLTTYVLQPSNDPAELSVRAIYETDLVATTSPVGVYASVRRYIGNALTGYYDIFYPDATADDFGPLVAVFETDGRGAVVEANGFDPFKLAKEQPFYFMWWPDPATASLNVVGAPVYATTDPRYEYSESAFKTSYFYTIPMFPNL